MLLMIPPTLGIWYGLSRARNDMVEVDKEVMFEEKITRGFEVLDLQV
jgi:hypothetical protein